MIGRLRFKVLVCVLPLDSGTYRVWLTNIIFTLSCGNVFHLCLPPQRDTNNAGSWENYSCFKCWIFANWDILQRLHSLSPHIIYSLLHCKICSLIAFIALYFQCPAVVSHRIRVSSSKQHFPRKKTDFPSGILSCCEYAVRRYPWIPRSHELTTS